MDLTIILIIIISNFLLTLSICGILHKQIAALHKETILLLEHIERIVKEFNNRGS